MKLSDTLLRFCYFFFGFFLALAALILFVRFSGIFKHPDPASIIIRHHVVHDIIPPEDFQSVTLPETLPATESLVWHQWIYEDTILKIQFESPAFRNFHYWFTLPGSPIVSPSPGPQVSWSKNFSIIFSLTTEPSAHLLFGYKSFLVHLQYLQSPISNQKSTIYYGFGYHLRF